MGAYAPIYPNSEGRLYVVTIPTAQGVSMHRLLEWQRYIEELHGNSLIQNTKESNAQLILSLMTESAELGNLMNWKPWKKEFPLDEDRVVDEWGDVFSFFLIVTILVEDAFSLPADALVARFLNKTGRKILERVAGQQPGYGGTQWESRAQAILDELP